MVTLQAAHYLVLTLLSRDAITAPMGAVYEGRPQKRPRLENAAPIGPFELTKHSARQRR